jgi:hypothetical protein
MSLIFVEGFDYLNAIEDKYTVNDVADVDLTGTVTRFDSGFSVRIEDIGDYFDIPITPSNEVYVGWADYRGALPSSSGSTWLMFRGDADFRNGDVRITTTGAIQLVDADGTVRATSSVGVVEANRWHFYEVKFKVIDSCAAGDFSVRIDGTEVVSIGAGFDLKRANNSTTNTYTLRFSGITDTFSYWDDIYVCNNSGSVNNTFLGDSRIDTLYPDSDGNANQFDGSDGNSVNNFELVDEAQNDGDTTYVESSTATEKDQYGFDAIAEPTTIHGVSVCSVARKDDAGARTGKIITRSGGADYEGSEFTPSTSYGYFDEIWEEDPDTSTAWTESGINAAEFGIKVES